MSDHPPDPASAEARIRELFAAAFSRGFNHGADGTLISDAVAASQDFLSQLAVKARQTPDNLAHEIRQCLSTENENVRRCDWVAAMRDVRQILVTSKDNAAEAVCQLDAMLANVATLTEQLTSANARFCDQHRGIYRTSGCVVCGLMAAAVELRESEAKAATLTGQLDSARTQQLESSSAGLRSLLSSEKVRRAALEAQHRRALEQMDTETARANGLGEINQQLGARARELERVCRNCDTTLARCYDCKRFEHKVACCPECDHGPALAAIRATEAPQEQS